MSVEVFENLEVKNQTTFKIGGKIKHAYFPESQTEFEEIIAKEPKAKVFGNFSNTLVSTSGYDGAVIITSKMNNIVIEGSKVTADCGVKGPLLSQNVCEKALSGFEFMIGFPGSVGGNICMNASAQGQAISDNLISVTCFSAEKGIFKLSKEELDFSYRTSRVQKENLVVLSASFALKPSDKEEIKAKMNENLNFRKSHQPSMVLPNCGSVFRNPEGHSAGRLLEEAGAKKMTTGGVRVWENHANFIINDRAGTSADVLNLMICMKNAVKEKFDIDLSPELRYLGSCEEEEKLWKLLIR